MDTQLELGSLGIISGEQRRLLDYYIDDRYFRQRKTYDEYYIATTSLPVEGVNIAGLMVLAEGFKVLVLEDCVLLGHL